MKYSQEQLAILEDALRNMYEDNMDFLKIYDNGLYNDIYSLTDKIDNNEYEVRYELEFINNSFNVFDKQKGIYLYEESLIEYNNKVLNEIDYSFKSTIANISNKHYDLDHVENLRLFNNDIQSNAYAQIVSDINEFKIEFGNPKKNSHSKMTYVPGFVFFGTLLGSHLSPLQQKLKLESCLVVEPDIELFRLSLFVTEYKILVQNAKLFFSIGSTDTQMLTKMQKYILFGSTESYLYKYYSTSYHDKQLFSNFTLALSSSNPFDFNHYRQLFYAKESINRIKKYPVLIVNKLSSEIIERPVLILSPGPSLRNNIKWVQKNNNKFITIAFGASIKILHEFGIKPDIITSVDSSTLILKQLPPECKSTYENALALLGTDSHKDVFKLFKKENIFVGESNFKLLINGIKESASITVGDNTLHIMLSMGFKKIYLLGTDLAIDVNDGVAYDKTHFKNSKEKHQLHHLRKNIKKISDDIDLTKNYIKMESNFKNKTLYSDQLFIKILGSYDSIISTHQSTYSFEIFNLSEGAYIPRTTPLRTSKINLQAIKKSNTEAQLREFFLKKSQKDFIEEKIELAKEVKFLNELMLYIKDIKKVRVLNKDEFYDFRRKYTSKITEHKSYSLLTTTFLLTHIKIIDNYINFVLNDDSFNCSELMLLNIKSLWCKEVESKIKEYKKTIKKL